MGYAPRSRPISGVLLAELRRLNDAGARDSVIRPERQLDSRAELWCAPHCSARAIGVRPLARVLASHADQMKKVFCFFFFRNEVLPSWKDLPGVQ